jgi:cytidylate kinase
MGEKTYEPAVTVSATYGTGGSVIAPRLAEELGLPFIDRLISADFSQDAARQLRSEEGLVEGEQAISPAGRFLSYFARAASVGSMMAPDPMVDDDEQLRARVSNELAQVAEGAGAVVLGRAGAVVLASRPRAFHVRLDGDVGRRTAWAAGFENLTPAAAARRQSETDKARTMFVKRLYRTDPADARLYHLVIDPTAVGIDASVEIILTAVRAFLEAHP